MLHRSPIYCRVNNVFRIEPYIKVKGQAEVKVMWHVWAHPMVILTKISHDRYQSTAGLTMLTTYIHTHPFWCFPANADSVPDRQTQTIFLWFSAENCGRWSLLHMFHKLYTLFMKVNISTVDCKFNSLIRLFAAFCTFLGNVDGLQLHLRLRLNCRLS